MGADPGLVRRIICSGENHGEAFWELPLVDEYKEPLKSPFADLNNIDTDWRYHEAGAIGFGLKTLVDLCERFHDPAS